VRFLTTPIPGVIHALPDVHRDARGFFLETYHAPRYREGGIRETFVQDNHSRSTRDTLRGLHIQLPNAQGKLVRAIEGEIWDVAVDVRRGSPAYGKHFAARLTAEGFEQLYCSGPRTAPGAEQWRRSMRARSSRSRGGLSIAEHPDLAFRGPEPPALQADRRAPRLRDVQSRLIDYSA
jgi:dTDP-4-dehydrorhamnose 3,5-epimerase